MKKVLFAVILSVLLSVPALADPFTGHGDCDDGGTANYIRLSGYYAGAGGEFTIYGTGLLLSNDAYSPKTSAFTWGNSNPTYYPESFQTFCLETDEYAASPMKIWVSEASVNETNGNTDAYGSGSHAWRGGSDKNFGDNLEYKTAWLYTQFATGVLNEYAYTGTDSYGLNRSQTAAALQWLIWTTEGESGSSYVSAIAPNAAQQALISLWESDYATALQRGWSGIGNVRVLQNYYYGYGCNYGNAQDFLYLVPVPVPGAMLLGLLGMAVAGAKLRKFA